MMDWDRMFDAFREIAQKPCDHCGVEIYHHDERQIDECFNAMKTSDKKQTCVDQLKRIGALSKSFGEQKFSNLNPDIVNLNPGSWTKAQAWRKGSDVGLYIYGPPGTGKTHAARCILDQVIDSVLLRKNDHTSIGEVTAYKLVKESRRFNSHETLELYENLDYLLIDDMDKVDWSSSDLSYLWSLFNERSNNECRTIITANVEPKRFREIFAHASAGNESKIEATLQRLHPVSVLEFAGKSVRGMAHE